MKKVFANKPRFTGFSFLVILVLAAGFLAFVSPEKTSAAAGVPQIIGYQGRLSDIAGDLLGGASGTNYYFRFSIYDASTSGTKLWPSGTPCTHTRTVREGVFTAGIGDTSECSDVLDFDFQDNSETYLEVSVSSDNSTFETLTPRQRITSSGYALNASTTQGYIPGSNAGQLLKFDSFAAGDILYSSSDNVLSKLAKGTDGLILAMSGGLPSWTATTSIPVAGDVSGTLSATVVADDSHSHTGSTISGLAAADFSSANISQWTNDSVYITAASTLTGLVQSAASGNSYFTGGNLGIGTTTPNWKLQLSGARPLLTLSDTSGTANAKHWFMSSQNGNFFIGTSTDALSATTTYFTIANGGNIGIGTTTPLEKLTVNGNIISATSTFSLGTTAMDTTADTTFSGVVGNNSVSSAGDVNGDGYTDVIVGAYLADVGGTDRGQAYIYYGGPSMDNTADVTFTGGADNDNLGFSVASAGDVNGDGYSDVIVGAYGADAGGTNKGQAYIYYGGSSMDSTADITFSGGANSDNLGYSVSSAGDVNGDGYTDVIVGAYRADAGGTDKGQAYIYYGGLSMDNTADVTFSGGADSDNLGGSVSSAGDVNGDGYSDVIVGAPLADAGGTDKGQAYIYYGGSSMDNTADVTFSGGANSDYLGWSVSSAGDVNGDGYTDVIVGAPYVNGAGGGDDRGQAHIYYGGSSMNNTADVTFSGTANYDYLGYSVSSAGDVNGDGYTDVIVGAYGVNVGVSADRGQAYIYYGGSSMDNSADVTFTGVASSDFLSYDVSSAGDVNGDGYDDVIVGAYGASASYIYTGAGNKWQSVFAQNFNASRGLKIAGLSMDRYGLINTTMWGITTPNWEIDRVGSASFQNINVANYIVATSSKLGIGTTTPQWLLQVNGTRPSLALSDSSASANLKHWLFSSMGGNLYIGTSTDSYGTSTPSALTILNSGYTGIGTSTPGSLFSLGSTANFTSATSTFYGTGGMDISDGCYSIDGTCLSVVPSSTSAGQIPYYSSISSSLTPTSTLTIHTNSYIGIGTTTPNWKLQISSTRPLLTLSDTSGTANAKHWFMSSQNGNFFIGTSTDALSATTTYFTIANGGNIGIGTTTPLEKLTVNGNIISATSTFSLGTVSMNTSTTSNYTFSGGANNDYLGWSVSSAGDVNGDGYNDVIVGAPYVNGAGTDRGQAYIYYGGSSMNNTADVTFTGGADNDQLGYSVSSAGDVNGDGYDDVIVGALNVNGAGTERGQAYIYYGGSSMNNTADVNFLSVEDYAHLGNSVSSAGDVNGDGYTDVIVGANDAAGGGWANGQAYLYFGGPSMDNTADVTFSGGTDFADLGSSVSSAGDVNGDGYTDVIVGASGDNSNTGKAYIYYGGPAMDNTADVTFTGGGENYQLGISVSSAGDVNGDGYTDVIVGASDATAGGTSRGQAYIYYGGSSMDNTADVTFSGGVDFDYLGTKVSSTSDVNGDGYSDVIVGAYQAEAGGTDRGQAYIYYGGSSMDNIADVTFSGGADSDYLGSSVSSAGDVNGDGYADVIVGAFYANSGAGKGQAYIYTGTGNKWQSVFAQNFNASRGLKIAGLSMDRYGLIN
ncbi:MAG: FG-GAP-like repeat-containing protein, partial [Candidatus Pacebacteria bacterium]|nr:FG-GAP-like repeat-containing protein [Candidatus Paceibacterota bacterium]